jgi:hypothetical protein
MPDPLTVAAGCRTTVATAAARIFLKTLIYLSYLQSSQSIHRSTHKLRPQ